ncbi:LacI family DNA-binding transcriptional regulator [Sporolactobacillus sp. KGMB 08714]|uniref:LacI family DNA-binding transcriptional regulator n=1 Tax=Sporolactobacillus sp. KGMB 08714 TaxID=3064704 RepID=UPI002FBE3343
MKDQVTLKDIAKMAGVSVSTVSRVLNGNAEKAARDLVREKIWQIAKESHYVPNKTAQSLKKGNPDADKHQLKFGIIFARLDRDDYNPFFMKLARVIEKEIMVRGDTVEFSMLSAALRITDANSFFAEHCIDGLLILGKFSDWLYDKVRNHVKAYIYVGLNRLLYSELDQVICNGYSAAVTAVNYLHDQGHENIMYLGETSGEMRYKGYTHTMRFFNDKVSRKNIVECRFTIKSAYQALLDQYDPQFTAIFCGNDLAGIGAIQALTELRYRIPEDVSVISIDDIDLIQDYKPLLTTVHIPLDELGRMSVRMILERINKIRKMSVIVEFPYQLLKRQTVSKK